MSPRVTLDGVEYEVRLPPPEERLCGLGQSFHQHDYAHDEDVPAGTSHHHHTAQCLQIRAVLVPVGEPRLPVDVVVRQGKEWWAVPVPADEAPVHGVTPYEGAPACTK